MHGTWAVVTHLPTGLWRPFWLGQSSASGAAGGKLTVILAVVHARCPSMQLSVNHARVEQCSPVLTVCHCLPPLLVIAACGRCPRCARRRCSITVLVDPRCRLVLNCLVVLAMPKLAMVSRAGRCIHCELAWGNGDGRDAREACEFTFRDGTWATESEKPVLERLYNTSA
ncbi:hypothetical protein BDZ97DRAFT_299412 [Flammula alnicola]|nr:hypothetical protein BDZ97DRAFT_299412 [Flammula alnicola]